LEDSSGLKAKKKITVIGGVVNLVLSILKISLGWLGQSHALIADGFHSLSDLLTDGLVYFASHHAAKRPMKITHTGTHDLKHWQPLYWAQY